MPGQEQNHRHKANTHEMKAATTVLRMQSLLVIGAASLLLAACNTTSALRLPKAQAPKESPTLRTADSLATFALGRIANGIAQRDPIFTLPGSPSTSDKTS
jgi:uncharacterized lipoprotein YajG